MKIKIAETIIKNANTQLNVMKHMDEYGYNAERKVRERYNYARKIIISKQNLRAFVEKIKTVFKELLEKFKRAVQAVSDAWKNFQASDVQKQYKEDSTIVTAKTLTRQRERRKREREWRRCWSQ